MCPVIYVGYGHQEVICLGRGAHWQNTYRCWTGLGEEPVTQLKRGNVERLFTKGSELTSISVSRQWSRRDEEL